MTVIQDWFGDLRTTVLIASSTILLVLVIGVGIIKRSLLAAFGTLLGGVLLLWGMANSDWLRDKAGEDFDTAPVPAVVVDVDSVAAQ